MSIEKKQITYRDAGVDTSEGARAVNLIKPMVATTTRPECIGGLGGFGGLFSAENIKKKVSMSEYLKKITKEELRKAL